jgi:hypothetical protein
VVREAANEELGALLARHAGRMACEGLEAVGEVLHRGGERQTPKFRQATSANWGAEA